MKVAPGLCVSLSWVPMAQGTGVCDPVEKGFSVLLLIPTWIIFIDKAAPNMSHSAVLLRNERTTRKLSTCPGVLIWARVALAVLLRG